MSKQKMPCVEHAPDMDSISTEFDSDSVHVSTTCKRCGAIGNATYFPTEDDFEWSNPDEQTTTALSTLENRAQTRA